MSTQEQTDHNRRQPASEEILVNGRWISVDDCQAPYTEQQPAAPTGGYTTDEAGRQVWSDHPQSEY
jgi:hypothetical protein